MRVAKEVRVAVVEASCAKCDSPLVSPEGSFLLKTGEEATCSVCGEVHRMPKWVRDVATVV